MLAIESTVQLDLIEGEVSVLNGLSSENVSVAIIKRKCC